MCIRDRYIYTGIISWPNQLMKGNDFIWDMYAFFYSTYFTQKEQIAKLRSKLQQCLLEILWRTFLILLQTKHTHQFLSLIHIWFILSRIPLAGLPLPFEGEQSYLNQMAPGRNWTRADSVAAPHASHYATTAPIYKR